MPRLLQEQLAIQVEFLAVGYFLVYYLADVHVLQLDVAGLGGRHLEVNVDLAVSDDGPVYLHLRKTLLDVALAQHLPGQLLLYLSFVFLPLEVPQERLVVVLEALQSPGLLQALKLLHCEPHAVQLAVHGCAQRLRVAQDVEQGQHVLIADFLLGLEHDDLKHLEGLLVGDPPEDVPVAEHQPADGRKEVPIPLVEEEGAAGEVGTGVLLDVDDEGGQVPEQPFVNFRGQPVESNREGQKLKHLLVLQTVQHEKELLVDKYLDEAGVDGQALGLDLSTAERQPHDVIVKGSDGAELVTALQFPLHLPLNHL